MQDLGGKTVVITGGASGIGRAMALAFWAAGANVVVGDIDTKGADALVGELGADRTHAVEVDVTDEGSVVGLRDAALERFGAVHVVCNNAGIAGATGPSWEVPVAGWALTFDVNLWSVIHGIRTFVPMLIEQGEGHIVNTASLAGLLGTPMLAPYSATKHAVIAISESLLHEIGMTGSKVGVSVLCPGWVNTPITTSAAAFGAAGEAVVAAFGKSVEEGMDPADVAAMVVDSVQRNNFWILTHPELSPGVTERYRRAVAGEHPWGVPVT